MNLSCQGSGQALGGLAPSAGALIVARVLQAVGGAMVMPTSLGFEGRMVAVRLRLERLRAKLQTA